MLRFTATRALARTCAALESFHVWRKDGKGDTQCVGTYPDRDQAVAWSQKLIGSGTNEYKYYVTGDAEMDPDENPEGATKNVPFADMMRPRHIKR
jgi:hypothetical protein